MWKMAKYEFAHVLKKSPFMCLLKDCESAKSWPCVAQCILYCYVIIVIYVDNICIRWETDQKCSPKTLISSVIVSVLANCLKRAETDIVLSVLDIRAYIVSFSASLDMNQVPEKLYIGQNLKQHVMKEQRSAYKSYRYIEKNILNLLLDYPDQNISNQF